MVVLVLQKLKAQLPRSRNTDGTNHNPLPGIMFEQLKHLLNPLFFYG
jgi:hypothetical protein